MNTAATGTHSGITSPRINKLHAALDVNQYPLCLDKSRLWIESFRHSEGEPQIVRRAKALAYILDNINIFIEDGELIVGNTASKPMGLEVTFWSGLWPQDEIDGLKAEGFSISPEDEREIQVHNEYWRGKTLTDRFEQLFDEERLWPFMQEGVILPPWKKGVGWSGRADSGMGLGPYTLVAVDYAKVLNGGLNALIHEAVEELRGTRITNADSIQKIDFLKSVITSHQAIIRFAHRFSALAAEKATQESDPARKLELEQIAEICQRVPAYPARTFHEAIQSVWFIFLMLNPNMVASLGRFDQYMYPFYADDIAAGRTTDEQVVELLQCFRIKDMQLIRTSSRAHREKWAGMAKWHNCIIGGQTPEGKDATNRLSYLVLEAAQRCRTPHHTITVRVHDGTPEDLMLKALEVVSTGIGIPAFIGDKAYVEYLLGEGVPLKLARDYTLAGCIDANLTGKSRILADPMFIATKVLEYTLNNGMNPRTRKQLGPQTGAAESFQTFDDFMQALREQFVHFMALTQEHNNIKIKVWSELFPDPVTSSLMDNAIQEGKALFDRSFPYENAAVMNPVGMMNVADGLAAMKKLVYDEKRITLPQLVAALNANWQGEENTRIHQMCLAAPKYGNNDEYVDSIARDLYRFWAEAAVTFDTATGGKHKPSAISISSQWPGGALTGATPDGRCAFDCLADGALSAMRGMDTHGPTSLIQSAMKVDQTPYQATLLNVKFHPSALKTAEDLRKLSSLIRTYFSCGGKHIQFNVVDRSTLIEAQKHPEQHRDLVVRIAGYSAYFVQLGKVIQDEIIGRMEHEFS